MKFGWQSLVGPVFWIGATYLVITYGPGWIAELQGRPEVESRSILGQKFENVNPANEKSTLGKIIPDKLPASPQEVPEFVREIIERTTNTVIEKGQTEVEEKKTEVVKSTCGQIIAEIEKQCNISTSNQ